MMAILHLGYVLARRRLMSSFRIELTVLLGVTLAVVLLSSAVVFNDLLAETALRRTLTEAESSDVNIWVRVFNDLDDPRTATAASDRYQQAKQFVAQRFVPPMVEAIEAASMQVETATSLLLGAAEPGLAQRCAPAGADPVPVGAPRGQGPTGGRSLAGRSGQPWLRRQHRRDRRCGHRGGGRSGGPAVPGHRTGRGLPGDAGDGGLRPTGHRCGAGGHRRAG